MITIEEASKWDYFKIHETWKEWERRQIDILGYNPNYRILNLKGVKVYACVFHRNRPQHKYSILEHNRLCNECVLRAMNNIDLSVDITGNKVLEVLNKE